GSFLGGRAMPSRKPGRRVPRGVAAATRRAIPRPRAGEPIRFALPRSEIDRVRSGFNFEYSVRLQAFKKRLRSYEVELFVSSLDTKEKSVRRGKRESRRVKDRAIRSWHAVQRKHPEYSR